MVRAVRGHPRPLRELGEVAVLSRILFYAVVFAANVIQGITGFAGTILAMPPSLMLVGYDVAKPVLNLLGLLSGVYVLAGAYRHVRVRELVRIVAVMAAGIVAAGFVRGCFAGREQVLYKLLGVFVVVLSVRGIYKVFLAARRAGEGDEGFARVSDGAASPAPGAASYALLLAAGVVHGLFVCGGPLLIGYLARRVPDKTAFRVTISAVWIFLNGLILATDIRAGLWTPPTIGVGAVSVPFLAAGMFVGTKLYARMSQELFMRLTYVLLLVSGLSLLVK